MELASLGNKVIIADGMEIKNLDAIKYALKKVAGYVTIGLESLSGSDARSAADWISKSWLHAIFQLGYSRVYNLVEDARRLQNSTRFRWIDRYHCLACHSMEASLKGLLRPRPLFFEGEGADNLFGFRDFFNLEEVHLTAERLAATRALADFFIQLSLPPEKIKTLCLEGGLGDRLDTIKWRHVLHTIWVWKTISGNNEFRVLTPDDLTLFLRKAFITETDSFPRRLEPSYLQTLTDWVNEQHRGLAAGPHRIIMDWIRNGTNLLEEELGGLVPEHPIKHQFIQGLCIGPLPPSS